MLCKMCKMDCVIIVMLWVVIGAPRSYPVVDLLVSLSRLPMPILQHVFSDPKMPMEEGEVLIRTTVFVDMEKIVFQKLSGSHFGRGKASYRRCSNFSRCNNETVSRKLVDELTLSDIN